MLLRQRIERALQMGTVGPGDRLPGIREVAGEVQADPRVVLAAYGELAKEGLIEIRPRSGVYVAPRIGRHDQDRVPSPAWIADVAAAAVCRGVALPKLHELFKHATATRTVRAAVIATTSDQAVGVARELSADYGVAATPLLVDALHRDPLRAPLRRAHLLVTTEMHAAAVRRLAARLSRPEMVICVRNDLLSSEWRLLMKYPVYVVASDPRFLRLVREFIAGEPGAENVRMLVAGRDDLSVIPADTPTYVTQSARQQLGRTRLPGRLIPPVRLLAPECVQQIARAVVDINLRVTLGDA